MSPKIVVRARMPDTNSSSGVFVAYSSPPPPEVDIPLKTLKTGYGSYTILSPQDLPRVNNAVPRLATLRGRAQWLLGILINEIPLPRLLTKRITSESDATELYSVMRQYLAGEIDREIEEFIRTVQLSEADYYERFLARRKLLLQYIHLIENPEKNKLPEGVPRSTKVVIHIPEVYTLNSYFPAGDEPREVMLPPGWFMGSFFPGADDGYILIEPRHDKFAFDGRIKDPGKGPLARLQHRLLLSPLSTEIFMKEVLQGYLAPEYFPTLLDDPHPFLSLADLVDVKTKLFCVSIGEQSLEMIKESLMTFAGRNRVKGVLRSATLFYPAQQLSSLSDIEKEVALFLYDFASRCGMSVSLHQKVVVRRSHDERFHLSMLCSANLYTPILE